MTAKMNTQRRRRDTVKPLEIAKAFCLEKKDSDGIEKHYINKEIGGYLMLIFGF